VKRVNLGRAKQSSTGDCKTTDLASPFFVSRADSRNLARIVAKQPGVHRATTLAHHVTGLNELDPSHTAAIQNHLSAMTEKGKMRQTEGGSAGFEK
jgi:hypothetical protein